MPGIGSPCTAASACSSSTSSSPRSPLTVAGYATATAFRHWWVACGVAVTGLLLALVFQRLDGRTRELVKVCEPALAEIEEKLRTASGLAQLNFVRAVDKPKRRAGSYRALLVTITWSAAVIFGIGFVYALLVALRVFPDA